MKFDLIQFQKKYLLRFLSIFFVILSFTACIHSKITQVPIQDKFPNNNSFELQYTSKNTMECSSGSFSYVDILPDEQAGEKIIIAPGCPITLKEMKRLLSYLSENGRRVVCPEHPDYGFFESPTKKRPEVLYNLLKEFKSAHLLAHSYGGIDVIRMVNKWLENGMPKGSVKSIILINAAGIRKSKGLYSHYKNFNHYVDSARSQEEATFLQQWKKVCDDYPLNRIIKETWDITQTDLTQPVQKLRKAGIKIVTIQTNDTLLYPEGINQQNAPADIKISEGGDHNGILFNPQKYCGPVILKLLTGIEKEPAVAYK